MMDASPGISEFWSWLQANTEALNDLRTPEDPFWDVIQSHLTSVNEGLFFEISDQTPRGREMVLTVRGDKALFTLVDQMVAAAPEIPGWIFVPLKPPMGFDFTTTYEGRLYDPAQMWFWPLVSETHPEFFGVCICIKDLAPDDFDLAVSASWVILETALGERMLASEIQIVKADRLPDQPEAEGCIELVELEAYLKWRKRRQSMN